MKKYKIDSFDVSKICYFIECFWAQMGDFHMSLPTLVSYTLTDLIKLSAQKLQAS